MGEDRTALVRELYDLPFHRANDVEVLAADADAAAVRWPYDESLVGNPEVGAVHGGVVSALADLTGAAPHIAAAETYTPTVDLRVDYLEHAGAADLTAESTVRRRGDRVGVSEVTVRSGGDRCAVGKGVYMLGE
jgi:uncharacterized protein (TIGR00369 family)